MKWMSSPSISVDELRQGVEPRLDLAPVVVRRPIAARASASSRAAHLARVRHGLLLGPARRRDARRRSSESVSSGTVNLKGRMLCWVFVACAMVISLFAVCALDYVHRLRGRASPHARTQTLLALPDLAQRTERRAESFARKDFWLASHAAKWPPFSASWKSVRLGYDFRDPSARCPENLAGERGVGRPGARPGRTALTGPRGPRGGSGPFSQWRRAAEACRCPSASTA